MKRFTYLAIPLVVLLTACQGTGGISNPLSSDSAPSADDVSTDGLPGNVDVDAAADKLGISSDALKNALGGQPIDVAAAAQKLGITEATLREALGSTLPL